MVFSPMMAEPNVEGFLVWRAREAQLAAEWRWQRRPLEMVIGRDRRPPPVRFEVGKNRSFRRRMRDERDERTFEIARRLLYHLGWQFMSNTLSTALVTGA